MKQISIILLICIYSLSILGISYKEFYCCGKLKSVSVTLAAVEQSKLAKENCNNGCCKTSTQYFKVKDNHVVADQITTPLNTFAEIHFFSSCLSSVSALAQEAKVINGSHAPPLYGGVPIYLSNCVFRV